MTRIRVFHVIGTTQYYGTCRMHIFKDCPQLQKKRVRRHTWGDAVLTGVIEETEYDRTVIRDGQFCKICVKRNGNRP